MSQNKGFMQKWGLLEITLLVVILLLCAGAAALGFFALFGFGSPGDNIANPPVVEATGAAVPTEAAPPPLSVPGDEEASSASITLNPTASTPGSAVEITGEGFPANSRVVIYLVPKDPLISRSIVLWPTQMGTFVQK
jgi:hypothetical protein